jgi:L-threonylcarbamoyladenylate synthase
VPIAAPSANRSGFLSPTTAEHVAESLNGWIDFILDGGPCTGGLESTVVDLSTPRVRLLRPGLISREELERMVGPVELANQTLSESSALPSPGMMVRHYAPRTALEYADSAEEAEMMARVYETAGLRVAHWQVNGTPAEVAVRFYADLHRLDHAGYDRIIATLPPNSEEWRAIRDRLVRAASE